MLYIRLLTIPYIHKHTHKFHRLHERHVTYISINTFIYNGKCSIYDCVYCVLCIHVYLYVYMVGGRVVGWWGTG